MRVEPSAGRVSWRIAVAPTLAAKCRTPSWEVVLDLAGKPMAMQGEKAGPGLGDGG